MAMLETNDADMKLLLNDAGDPRMGTRCRHVIVTTFTRPFYHRVRAGVKRFPRSCAGPRASSKSRAPATP